MMSVIQLNTEHENRSETWDGGSDLPDGLSVKEIPTTYQYDGKTVSYSYKRYTYPELGSPRMYDSMMGGVIVPISGKKYRIIIEVNYYDDVPSNAILTFIPTDESETEFTPYDVVAHHKMLVEEMKKRRDNYLEEDDEDYNLFYKNMAAEEQHNIDQIEMGDYSYSSGSKVKLFGQPDFVQDGMFPLYEGRIARHLVTFEDNWGDSGNTNIMIGLDEAGIPAKAWFEASCC
jgi:hypothetical protein